MFLQYLQNFSPIVRLGDNHEVLLEREQTAQAVAEDRMVVNDEDPDTAGHLRPPLRREGTRPTACRGPRRC